jgi:hypothetical protein
VSTIEDASSSLRQTSLMRIDWILRDIEAHNATDRKMVLSSICSVTLEHLSKMLCRYNIKAVSLSSKLSERKLRALVHDFEYQTNAIALINPMDIPSSVCLDSASHVYFVDGVSNVQLDTQVFDCVYNLGKRNPLQVVRFRQGTFDDAGDPGVECSISSDGSYYQQESDEVSL